MNPLRSVGIVFADLAQLLDRKHARVWFLLTVAVLAQIAFWYLASPGPALLAFQARDLPHAITTIGWSLALLLALPALFVALLGLDLRQLGLRRGDLRFGMGAAIAGVVIVVPLMYAGSFNKGLEATYPWAGAWVGRSLGTILAWVVLYGLYYVAFEFFYRGFLQRLVADAWGVPQAIWVETIASTLVHLGKPMAEVLAALPAGLAFGVIAQRSRSIVPTIIIHLAIGISVDLFVLAHQGLLLHH